MQRCGSSCFLQVAILQPPKDKGKLHTVRIHGGRGKGAAAEAGRGSHAKRLIHQYAGTHLVEPCEFFPDCEVVGRLTSDRSEGRLWMRSPLVLFGELIGQASSSMIVPKGSSPGGFAAGGFLAAAVLLCRGLFRGLVARPAEPELLATGAAAPAAGALEGTGSTSYAVAAAAAAEAARCCGIAGLAVVDPRTLSTCTVVVGWADAVWDKLCPRFTCRWWGGVTAVAPSEAPEVLGDFEASERAALPAVAAAFCGPPFAGEAPRPGLVLRAAPLPALVTASKR